MAVAAGLTAKLLCKLLFSGYVLAFPYRAHMQPNHVLLKVLSSSKYGQIACLQHAVERVLPCSPGNLTVNHCCKLMTGPNSKGSDTRLFGEPLTPHSYKDIYQQLLSIYRLFKPMKTILLVPKAPKEVQRHAGPTVTAQQSTYRPKETHANNWPSVTVSVFIFPQFLWEVKERRQL